MTLGADIMLYLKISQSVVVRHLNGMKGKIEKSINDKINEVQQRSSQSYYKEELCLLNSFLDNNSKLFFETILQATPPVLLEIYNLIKDDYNIMVEGKPIFLAAGIRSKKKADTISTVVKEIINDLTDIFNYDDFCKKKSNGDWDAYRLSMALNIRTCTYCNNQYIYTVIKERESGKTEFIMRPEFDHYYEKSRYPFFALSIYNLIPSCHYCNSVIKGKKSITQDKYLHPYIDERDDGRDYFDFYYGFSEPEKTLIKARFTSDKAKRTFDFFQMDLIYSHHSNITDSIIELAHRYPPSYIEDLVNNYHGEKINITKQSVARMVFSSYEITNPDDEVLGKLKKDIINKIFKDIYDM